jgi:hypothetical protein
MGPYRKKPTWAILPYSKLLPGSKALELLGCVVADIEHPTDHCVPRDASVFHKQLPSVLEVEDTDAKIILGGSHASHVDIRLAQIFGFGVGGQSSQKRSANAQTVVTRFLLDHPRVFKLLAEKDEYQKEILEMMDLNPVNKKTAYMVVGVKSCLDLTLSEIQNFDSNLEDRIQIPLATAIVASGMVLATGSTSLDINVNTTQSRMRKILSTHTAVGERIFAIQYRQIKRHRDWLKWSAPASLKYGDLEHMSNDVGLFGDSDDDACAIVEEMEEEKPVDSHELEVGPGLQAGIAVGDMLLADL